MGHPPAGCEPEVGTPDALGEYTERLSQDLSTCQSRSNPLINDPLSINLSWKARSSLAQPVEILSRSVKAVIQATGDHTQEQRPAKRCLPEPIETTKTSHRRACHTLQANKQSLLTHNKTSPGPRRFKPDLIATDTRSVRKGQSVLISQQNTAGHLDTCAKIDTGTGSGADACVPSESCFTHPSLSRSQQDRRHSFRAPGISSTPSDSSEESGNSRSHSTCTSVPGSSNKSLRDITHPGFHRESCGEEYSEYLLSLAAKSAHIQLQDQALAAFPNEQVYETVDHFAIDYERESEEDASMKYNNVKSRRQSSADLSWELEYMRLHKEDAEMRLRAMLTSGKPNSPREQKKDNKLPPLVGDDIVMPQSLSPVGTICENSNLDIPFHCAQDLCAGCEGLWCAAPRHGGEKGAGLWMGTCSKDENQPQQAHGLFPGIVTPMPRIESTGVSKGLSPSPSYTQLDRLAASPKSRTSHKRKTSHIQKAIESEFHDGFVTQIYNYLSLGYPCLARCYDHELSQISGISIEDLRRDDLKTDARGYVVAPENDGIFDACARWKALRLYIQEWARQEPGMAEDETNLEGWGLPERKGSWAI